MMKNDKIIINRVESKSVETSNKIRLLLNIFFHANSIFLLKNMNNIKENVSERNLVALLMFELKTLVDKSLFKDFYVDAEYNRNKGKLKTILCSSKIKFINITCDLIIHSRGEKTDCDNLLAIEMKKAHSSKQAKEKDRLRLKELTSKYISKNLLFKDKSESNYVSPYEIGIYYEIDYTKKIILIELYKNGALYKSIRNNIQYFIFFKKWINSI